MVHTTVDIAASVRLPFCRCACSEFQLPVSNHSAHIFGVFSKHMNGRHAMRRADQCCAQQCRTPTKKASTKKGMLILEEQQEILEAAILKLV